MTVQSTHAERVMSTETVLVLFHFKESGVLPADRWNRVGDCLFALIHGEEFESASSLQGFVQTNHICIKEAYDGH